MDAAYFRQLASYNTWANERIYAAAAELSDAERKAKRPSFFGSIHATLNHIRVGDRVWLSRLTAKPGGPWSASRRRSPASARNSTKNSMNYAPRGSRKMPASAP